MNWTEADYDELSWHDNHVHGIAIREGEHGTGELILDLDYIVEWIKDGNKFKFKIAPALLTFHRISDLIISLNYVNPSAAITPFSLSDISREKHVFANGYSSFRWSMGINWPEGTVSFIADGFKQFLRSEPLLVENQHLSTQERENLIRGT